MDEREDWGMTVRLLRGFRSWTQYDLAREAGVYQSLISVYERGLEVPTRATMERLAAAVGLPYSVAEEHHAWVRRVRARYVEPSSADIASVDVDGLMATLTASVSRALDEVVRPAAAELLRGVRRGSG